MNTDGSLAKRQIFSPRLLKHIVVQLELSMERMWTLIWRYYYPLVLKKYSVA